MSNFVGSNSGAQKNEQERNPLYKFYIDGKKEKGVPHIGTD